MYRGTWKHTDIAAKEYLPIEPAQEAPSSSSKDSPSNAAMAHARAALAKEVHWLTSLNHPNLVRFCAVCLERPLVVMEFYKVNGEGGNGKEEREGRAERRTGGRKEAVVVPTWWQQGSSSRMHAP